jgi:hypothetical protein
MKYPFCERNESAAFSLADETMNSRKVDDIGSNRQIGWERNAVHLVLQPFTKTMCSLKDVRRMYLRRYITTTQIVGTGKAKR